MLFPGHPLFGDATCAAIYPGIPVNWKIPVKVIQGNQLFRVDLLRVGNRCLPEF